MEIDIIQVQDPEELNILRGQEARFGDLVFSHPDNFINLLKDKLTTKGAAQFIVKEKLNFAGFISGYEDSAWSGYLFLNELFVNPDYQDRKVGTNLVNKLALLARDKNLKGLIVQTEFENMPAQKLYEKLGFARVESQEQLGGITYRLQFN